MFTAWQYYNFNLVLLYYISGSGINSSDLGSFLSSSTDLGDASLNGTPSQQVSFLDQDHSRVESAETRRTQFSQSRSNTLNKSFDAKLLLDKVIENVHKIVAFYESVGEYDFLSCYFILSGNCLKTSRLP